MLHYYANECVDDEVYVLRDWEKQEDGDDFLLALLELEATQVNHTSCIWSFGGGGEGIEEQANVVEDLIIWVF